MLFLCDAYDYTTNTKLSVCTIARIFSLALLCVLFTYFFVFWVYHPHIVSYTLYVLLIFEIKQIYAIHSIQYEIIDWRREKNEQQKTKENRKTTHKWSKGTKEVDKQVLIYRHMHFINMQFNTKCSTEAWHDVHFFVRDIFFSARVFVFVYWL